MGDNRIDFSKFFDFGDDTPITNAIKLIEKLEATYEKFVLTVEKQNSGLNASMESVKVEASQILKSLDTLNNSATKNADAYNEVAKSVEDLSTSQTNLKDQLDTNSKAIANATKQVEQLETAKENLNKANLLEIGSLNDIKSKLDAATKNYKALGDAVDGSIKESALKDVESLAKQYNLVNTALTTAKKSVSVASGSYNELQKNVNAAKISLKNLQGGLADNGEEVKQLKQYIMDGTAQLKAFDQSIGKNSIEDYSGALKDLKVELKAAKDALVGIAEEFGQDSDEFKVAAVNAGEIADKLRDVQEVVATTSGEPIERFTKSFGLLKDKLLSLDFKGANLAIKQIAAASSDLTFKDAIKGIGTFGQSLAQLGKAIITNPLFLIAGTIALLVVGFVKLADKVRPIAMIFEAAGQAIQMVTDAAKEFTDAIGLTSFQAEEYADRVVKAYDKAQQKISEYYDNEIAVANAAGANTELLELQKQKLINITSQAQIKALDEYKGKTSKFSQFLQGFLLSSFGVYVSAQNKLSDEQQAAYDKAQKGLQDSNAQIKQIEIKGYKERLQISDQFVDQRKSDAYDLAKTLNQIAQNEQQRIIQDDSNAYASRAAAAVKLTNLQIDQAKADAKQQEATLAIALRTLQERKDAEIRLTQDRSEGVKKALLQSQKDELLLVGGNKAKRNEIIARYDQLAKDTTVTVDQQIADINTRFGQEELGTRQHIATEITRIEAEKNEKIKQINLALKALNTQFLVDDLNQQIKHQETILANDRNNFDDRVNALKASLDLQEQVIDAEKQKELLIAAKTGEDIDKVNQKFADQRKDVENKLTNDLISLYTARYEKLGAIEAARKGINSDEATQNLNDSLKSGEITLTQYYYKKAQLEKASSVQQLQTQIDTFEKLRDLQKSYGYDTTELDQKIADAQVQIDQIATDTIIQNKQKLNDALNNLGQQALTSTFTFIQAGLQANIDSLNQQLANEQDKHDKSIALAGDDAQAKAVIDQNFANKKIQIEKQIAAEKRKQAIADKVRAAAETIINTARAVVAALPIIPLAVAVGALGALQLATIIATPIPAYAKGTKSAKGGLSLVGEEGPELGIHQGQVTLYDRPTVVDLKQGTEIKTASETRSLMQDAKQFGDGYMFDKKHAIYEQYVNSLNRERKERSEFKQFVKALDEHKLATVDAISKIETHYWDEAGYRRFTRDKNTTIEALNKKKHKF